MIVESVKTLGKFIGIEVELHTHRLIPCAVGFHLVNLLLKGERIIRRRRRGFALRLGRRGSLAFLGRTTAKLAELLAILFACDARINVRLDENEHPLRDVGKSFRLFAVKRILNECRVNLGLHFDGHTLDSLKETAIENKTVSCHNQTSFMRMP